jgi:pyrroloquinoline-quinone synthase
MELQSFLAALEERIARYDLLCHPYYKAWTAGQLTRDDLREYASDYYHHVAAFPAYLSALHSRLDDGAQRRAVLRNLCEEEIAGRPHSELWLDFAEGMGAERDEVRQREPLPEVRELIGEFRRVAREGSTAEALAAFYAYESQVPRVAKAKADGLAERYGADAKTCGYFTLHQFADVEHAQVWQELLTAEVGAHPEEAEAALGAAENAAQTLWHALDGMEARRMAAGNLAGERHSPLT